MTSLDPITAQAVQQFARRLKPWCGPIKVLVYGSRARGTHRPDSDADVAVILPGEPGRFMATMRAMSDIALDVMLDTGVNISPLPIWQGEWQRPDEYPNPRLLRAIAQDGISI